jgi:hypothetical protein
MRMPGFAVEAALSRACVQYRHVGESHTRAGANGIAAASRSSAGDSGANQIILLTRHPD